MKKKGQLTPLSVEERMYVSIIQKVLKNTSRKNPMLSPDLLLQANHLGEMDGLNERLTPPRLRKVVNHIRSNTLAPIISSSKGYYLSTDKKEIDEMVSSLEMRAASILKAASGLRQILQSIIFEEENGL